MVSPRTCQPSETPRRTQRCKTTPVINVQSSEDEAEPTTQSLSDTPWKSSDTRADYADGKVVGPFRMIRCLGEGGMGSVWEAIQSDPIQRRVALKLIKGSSGSKQFLARFELERQALAMMEHPNIAKILDAGDTDEGTPYFAMELVEGNSITKYCDQHQLPITKRLRVFQAVCSAVHHAHQKGVIHRDLKPGNILVSGAPDQPTPKVIDFGLAKALDQKITEQTMETQVGQILGTLKYMSPEQANAAGSSPDTRTDIYSLGIILQELLIGETPISRENLKQLTLVQLLERISTDDPEIPSRRLARFDNEQLAQVTQSRRTDIHQLTRLLSGDLDWIVGKTIAKDPERRYTSVAALSEDISRFLAGETVSARPPSWKYRARKSFLRHRVAYSAAALIFLSLIGGIVGTSYGLWRAESAEHQEFLRAESEKKLRKETEARLAQVEQGNDLLQGIFKGLDIRKVRDDDTPLEDELAKSLLQASEQIDVENLGDQLTVADLQNTLGFSLSQLGYGDEAIPLLQRSLEIRSNELGESDIETLTALNDLASAFGTSGDFAESLRLNQLKYDRVVELHGDRHHDALSAATNLALAYKNNGDLATAITLYEETLEAMQDEIGPDHEDTLTCLTNLGSAYQRDGKLELAIETYQTAIARLETVSGADAPARLDCLNNLSSAYADAGEFEQALKSFDATLDLMRQRLGPDHPNTLRCQNNLAGVYVDQGQYREGIELLELTLEQRLGRLGANHPDTLVSLNDLARAVEQDGQIERAKNLYEEAVEKLEAEYGLEHPFTQTTYGNLAGVYVKQGDFERAIPMLEELSEIRREQLDEDNPAIWIGQNGLALAYLNSGQAASALPIFEEALEELETLLGVAHRETLICRLNVADTLWATGQPEESIKLGIKNLELAEDENGEAEYFTMEIRNNLAYSYRAISQLDEAVALFEKNRELAEANFPADHPVVLQSLTNLAASYWSTDRLDLSIPLFEAALDIQIEKWGADHVNVLRTRANLGVNYKSAGEIEKAIEQLALASEGSLQNPSVGWSRRHLFEAYALADDQEALKTLATRHVDHALMGQLGEPTAAVDDMTRIAMELLQRDQFAAAETMLRGCVELREAHFAGEWVTDYTCALLGKSMQLQGNNEEALTWLQKGCDGILERESEIPVEVRNMRLISCLEWLIETAEETNPELDLTSYREKLKSVTNDANNDEQQDEDDA